MWIVRLALNRPRMVAVMAILIALLGVLSISRTPTDILPAINIPVVNVIWQYAGLSPQEMEGRVVRVSEAVITTVVSNVEHVESQALPGLAVEKVYFQPGTSISQAVAQISSVMQTILRTMPPGIYPPLIQQYDASDVPILQLALSSSTLPISKLYDLALIDVLFPLITVNGAHLSLPFGGSQRLINVDLDPQAMTAEGVTAQDVASAITAQNLILPAGTAKMGRREYVVLLNNSPAAVQAFNSLPIKTVNGATVFVRDVAHVRDGYGIQTSVVRVDGKSSVLMTILKGGDASTITVVDEVKARLPQIRTTLPPSVKLDLLLDQSVFVRASVNGVVREALIAAGLTGLMILLFLGSWRSTLVVVTSIPLSILASLAILGAIGQTLNVMTLGGLALAVGILVDDATVEIENNHRQMDLGKPLRQAILDGAAEVATPAFVSTLSICIVFIPILFLGGVGGALFAPLAIAVVFAMLASYLLSRTLVPTMVLYLLAPEARARHGGDAGHVAPIQRSIFRRISDAFEAGFLRFARAYEGALDWALAHRRVLIAVFLTFAFGSLALYPFIGRDFFPTVDAGQLRLHVRAPPGTRIEETEIYFQH